MGEILEKGIAMNVEENRIMEEALSLPADLRLRLIDALLESLNFPLESEIDREWAEVAERRVAEWERGAARTVPAEEVYEKLKKKYRE
jgi:putative addiction module component (TIGR02574 family)